METNSKHLMMCGIIYPDFIRKISFVSKVYVSITFYEKCREKEKCTY